MISTRQFIATISYIVLVVVVNLMVYYLPGIPLFGHSVTSADAIVGTIYLVRDFAQREIRHYIFFAMLLGAFISYLLSDASVALASVSGFLVGELIDWAIFTYSKKPLSERLIWSALISTPFDTIVFLYVASMLNPVSAILMIIGKWLGVFILWAVWRNKNAKQPQLITS